MDKTWFCCEARKILLRIRLPTLPTGSYLRSHWFWRLNRSHIMPSQMEGFKLAQEHGIPLRQLVWPILLSLALATVVGQWACLHVLYREGALAKCRGFAVRTGGALWSLIGVIWGVPTLQIFH
ncbi:MAG: DUF6785 family protein [Armatimonadota bacterium]